MATTIIDRLVVELGLDPKQFTKGQKEAAAAIIDTEKKVTKSGAAMIGSIRRVAAEFVSLFLVVKSIKDVVEVFKDLNESTRQLGIDSRNTDETAAALKDLGNAAEIAGGKSEDATATILALQKAIFNAQHTGAWSDQLTEYARLGVDTGVTEGKMRPAHDIMRDTAAALEQQYPDKGQRFQETQVLGLQGGMANLVGQGVKEFDRLWKEQQSIPQVTQGQTGSAQRLTESYDVLKQRIEAELRKILTQIEPALEKLFKGIGDFIAKHSGDISKGIESLLGWFSGPGPQNFVDGMTTAGEAVMDFAKAVIAGRDTFLHPITTTGKVLGAIGDIAHMGNQGNRIALEEETAEKKYGLPKGIMSSGLLPAHNMPGMADKIAQELVNAQKAMSVTDDGSKPDWDAAVDAVRDQFGIQNQQPDMNSDYMRGDPNAAKATTGAGASPGARAIISGSKPTADTGARGGGGVSMSVDKMNIYTQATDADGIASGISGAMTRKMTTNLADGALS